MSESLNNHIMSCPYCNGRHSKYCNVGRSLWLDNHALFIISLNSKESRQVAIAELNRNNPKWADVIENRVKELWRDLPKNKQN